MLTEYQSIKIEEFNYELPEDNIAKYPLPKRDESKLLVYQDNEIKDSHFSEIHDFLPENSMLLVNNTRVIPARLIFFKDTGAQIEVFCLEPLDFNGDYTRALAKKYKCRWKCIAGNLKKWKGTITLSFLYNNNPVTLYADIESRIDETVNVFFSWDMPDLDFATVVELAGLVPLPPYIKRKTEETDKLRYQTVYAQHRGSVAAPTAGLHFTAEVFNQLKSKNISIEEITLHVGAGTFKPVSVDEIGQHIMHAEHLIVEKLLLEKLLNHTPNPLIAVGTTTVRTIESLVQIARKIKNGEETDVFVVNQWDAYSGDNQDLTMRESLEILLKYMDCKKINHIEAQTSMMIVPGYLLRFFDAIITNFHQPKSTLLLLVTAFIDMDWKQIYQHSIQNNYRFLSYGDSSLLFTKNKQNQ
jgi:S-adenosylmethionine:tRNA ribosyltransferase-isomerase